METFDFAKIASREFAFLLDCGFQSDSVTPTDVVFVSALYRISIFYDTRSHEIDLGIRSMKYPHGSGASFDVLVSVFDREAAAHKEWAGAVETPGEVIERVRALAANFRRYVKLDRLKSPALWEEIAARGKAMFDARWPSITVEQVQARFSAMWSGKDYAGLIRLFDPLREHLTDDERHKLDLARERLSSENGSD